jgi:hypothetical protein
MMLYHLQKDLKVICILNFETEWSGPFLHTCRNERLGGTAAILDNATEEINPNLP